MKFTGSQFADIVKCKRQNIYKLVREGKLTKDENNKYDSDDRINAEYLLAHGITKKDIENYVLPKAKKTKKKQIKSKPIPKTKKLKPVKEIKVLPKVEKKEVEKKVEIQGKNDVFDDDDFEDLTGLPAKMMNMTMKQLVMRYGGQMLLDKWATILNKLMSASERDQKIQERRLDLIEKDFAVSKLFLYLETLSKLLFDYPEGCIDSIIAEIKSNKNNVRNLIVNDMRNGLGLLIEQSKKNIDRELDSLLSKYKKADDDD